MGNCLGSDASSRSFKKEVRGKTVAEWSPADVQDHLRALHLGGLVEYFERDGIDGKDLLSLSEEELIDHLQCTPLQARKIKSSLPKDKSRRQGLATGPAYAAPVITQAPAAPFPAVYVPPGVGYPAPSPQAAPPMAVPFPGAAAPPPVLVPLDPTLAAAPPASIPPVLPMPAPAAVAALPTPPPADAAPLAPPPATDAATQSTIEKAAPAAVEGAKAAPAVSAAKRASELERAALGLHTKAAEAQRHAGTYGQAAALLQRAEGKLHGAIKSLSVTSISSAMAVGRNIGVAARGVRGPARRMMMRGGPAQNIIEIATVRRADDAVKSAVADIDQARTIIPTIPFIQEASLSGARRGVFLGLLAPGVATGVLQMARVRQGLSKVEGMYQQVQQSRDWVARNHHTFQVQASTLQAQAAAKQTEAAAVRSVSA